ncbi:hypothetical protein M011DRAFT_10007 [Sporormia fimetaria CBS 119925]|uniref:Uncharacterized protein n=1 Tax=Sporormia fimetaria CBS 119925 TaxID=1340428 RepID=A0A6A6VN18_9PLEO|nr:hypothetical protein M011DRAFT_10007 [Sporormia fimetaria CBS 119925]
MRFYRVRTDYTSPPSTQFPTTLTQKTYPLPHRPHRSQQISYAHFQYHQKDYTMYHSPSHPSRALPVPAVIFIIATSIIFMLITIALLLTCYRRRKAQSKNPFANLGKAEAGQMQTNLNSGMTYTVAPIQQQWTSVNADVQPPPAYESVSSDVAKPDPVARKGSV